MSETQLLTIALAALPNMLAVLVGILINNARLNDTNTRIAEMRVHMDARFNDVDRRFDEMRDLWRSELRRVEEVIDARLKHLEDRGGTRSRPSPEVSAAYFVSKRTMMNVTWSLISTKAWGIPAGTKMTSPGLNTRET